MCDENQLLFCCSSYISSFDLDTKKLTWEKRLEIDSTPQYANLSYNSDSITIGLKDSEIIILNKKSGRQTDYVDFTKMITKTEEDNQIFAKISPDGRYLIYRNKSCINLYDRNNESSFCIADGLQSEYGQTSKISNAGYAASD